MAITVRQIANIGSPADDPTCPLPGTLYVPDPAVHPPPWNCIIGTMAGSFQQSGAAIVQTMQDLAAAGFLCLYNRIRLMNFPIAGQTTDGEWHQQTDDEKIAIRAMRSNPFGFGYSVTGWVGAVGGSGSAHHSLYCAIDGTQGDDKADAAVCMSAPTDFSDREIDVVTKFIQDVTQYGRSIDLAVLLSRSPIALPLANANPILHYNGDHEEMPLSQQTRFNTAIMAAGVSTYTAITNTGTLGRRHSFGMWPDIAASVTAWLINAAAAPPPPPPGKPSPAGIFSLMIADTLRNPIGDIATLYGPEFASPIVTTMRFRGTWEVIEPTVHGTFVWTNPDTTFTLARANGKRVGINVSAGVVTPERVYTEGAVKYDLADGSGSMPIPWDPVYQALHLDLMTAFAAKYEDDPTLAYVVIDGFSQKAALLMGDATDEANLNVIAIADGYPDVYAAWLDAAKKITTSWATLFPTTPIIVTLSPVFASQAGIDLQFTYRDWALNTFPQHWGTIITSLRGTVNHGPQQPLTTTPKLYQMFWWAAGNIPGDRNPDIYNPLPPVYPPDPQGLFDCLEEGVLRGGWGCECYKPDLEQDIAQTVLFEEGEKFKANSPNPENLPPDKLHRPTFSPFAGDANTDVTMTCFDTGAHLFYTLGPNPATPTHTGDVATGTTIRIGSNTGIVNSGAGGNFFKVLAYQSGMTDSDVGTSGVYGTTSSNPLPSQFNLPFHPVDDPTLTLHGYLYLPNPAIWGPGPYPALIGTRSGGFTDGGPNESNFMFHDIAGTAVSGLTGIGFLCLFFDCRLAKDLSNVGGLPGQTTDGHFAQQTDDCAMAMLYMRSHPLCDGFVAMSGGSGSGGHAAYMAVTGTPGTTRPNAAISLSGELDASDRELDVSVPFVQKVELYYETSDLPTLEARSPIHFVDETTPPIYIANGQHENMPYSVFTRFKAKLDSVPLLNYESHVNILDNGARHSFGTYPENADAIKAFLLDSKVNPPQKLHKPTFTPDGGPDHFTDTLIACSDTGAHLFYTIGSIISEVPFPEHDGDNPLPGTIRVGFHQSIVNSGPGVTLIRVLAYQAGFIDSDTVTSNVFGAATILPKPTFTPDGSTGLNTSTTIACTSTGAHIFYTHADVTGSIPDPTHTDDTATGTTIRIGSNSGSVSSGGTVSKFKALAYQSGFADSAITTSNVFGTDLRSTLHAPTFAPNGSASHNVDVTISCADVGAHIFYRVGSLLFEVPDPTHDGDTPTNGTLRIGANSGVVNSGSGVTLIKAVAYQDGFIDSLIARSNPYGTSITQIPGAPIFTPDGSIHANIDLVISCDNPDAHIFYTIGGSTHPSDDPPNPTHVNDTPTGSTQRIGSNSGIVNCGDGLTSFKALAYVAGSPDSEIVTSKLYGTGFVIQPPPLILGAMNRILENAVLGSDLGCEGFRLLNIGTISSLTLGLVETTDDRLSDSRDVPDDSVTDVKVASNADIAQSKLDFNDDMPTDWIGGSSIQAAQGNLVQYSSAKGANNGYVPLQANATFSQAFLTTGLGAGTITTIQMVLPDPFQVLSAPVTNSGTLAGTVADVADNTWLGIDGGVGINRDLIPSFLTIPIPLTLVPSLATAQFTTGTFTVARLPQAVGLGTGHAAGLVTDPGVSASGDTKDYLGRDLNYHSFQLTTVTQPRVRAVNIILQSYHLGQGQIRIRTLQAGANLFYRIVTPTTHPDYTLGSSTDFAVLVDVGNTVQAYAARAGYDNSPIASFTVPPQ